MADAVGDLVRCIEGEGILCRAGLKDDRRRDDFGNPSVESAGSGFFGVSARGQRVGDSLELKVVDCWGVLRPWKGLAGTADTSPDNR
jgi:hypothetical protein